jgi:hypothetical protein
VPRSARSDVAALMQEARAVELVVNDAEIDPARLQDYWSLSADLITLVLDIETFQQQSPDAGYDDPELLALRRRLRDITSRLADISVQ